MAAVITAKRAALLIQLTWKATSINRRGLLISEKINSKSHREQLLRKQLRKLHLDSQHIKRNLMISRLVSESSNTSVVQIKLHKSNPDKETYPLLVSQNQV